MWGACKWGTGHKKTHQAGRYAIMDGSSEHTLAVVLALPGSERRSACSTHMCRANRAGMSGGSRHVQLLSQTLPVYTNGLCMVVWERFVRRESAAWDGREIDTESATDTWTKWIGKSIEEAMALSVCYPLCQRAAAAGAASAVPQQHTRIMCTPGDRQCAHCGAVPRQSKSCGAQNSISAPTPQPAKDTAAGASSKGAAALPTQSVRARGCYHPTRAAPLPVAALADRPQRRHAAAAAPPCHPLA